MIIEGISYDWMYIDNNLVLMIEGMSVIFKDGKIAMERIAAKELEAQMEDDGFTWPTWAQQEFELEFMNDEAQLKAYCEGAWSDRIIEQAEPAEESAELKKSA